MQYSRVLRNDGRRFTPDLQGYLAHKKLPPPRTLPWAYAQGPKGVGVSLWARYPFRGWGFGLEVGCLGLSVEGLALAFRDEGFRFGVYG